jgi:hypothetical protein
MEFVHETNHKVPFVCVPMSYIVATIDKTHFEGGCLVSREQVCEWVP